MDLAREHLRACDNMVAERALRRLSAAGVSGCAIVAAGLIGMERVEFLGPFYQPCPGGKIAFVAPVFDGAALVDLCAWRPQKPEQWAQRLDVGFALGDDAVKAALWSPETPLQLFPSPMRWLQTGAVGACILRPSEAWFELRELSAVVAVDIEHGNAVDRMLTPPTWRRPEVLVRRKDRAS